MGRTAANLERIRSGTAADLADSCRCRQLAHDGELGVDWSAMRHWDSACDDRCDRVNPAFYTAIRPGQPSPRANARPQAAIAAVHSVLAKPEAALTALFAAAWDLVDFSPTPANTGQRRTAASPPMSFITTTILLSLGLLISLTACQPQLGPTPPEAGGGGVGDTQRFWNCIRAAHSRYHQRNPIYRFFNPEPSAALAAARHCAASNLPEYAGDRQSADPASTQAADCIDQALADYAKARGNYPDQPDPP